MKKIILLLLAAASINSSLIWDKHSLKSQTDSMVFEDGVVNDSTNIQTHNSNAGETDEGADDYEYRYFDIYAPYTNANDCPEFATYLFDEKWKLLDIENRTNENYQVTLYGTIYHDRSNRSIYPLKFPRFHDDDFYAFNLFRLSNVEICLDDLPLNVANNDLITLELYRYQNFYNRFSESNKIFKICGASVINSGKGRTIKIENLIGGDYAIRVGCYPRYFEDSFPFDGTNYFYSKYDKYKLNLKVSKSNDKYHSEEEGIDILDLKYSKGCFGAIWKPDLCPFGYDDIIFDSNRLNPHFRNFGYKKEEIAPEINLPLKASRYSASNEYVGKGPFLTSKIYIWDPLILRLLQYILLLYDNSPSLISDEIINNPKLAEQEILSKLSDDTSGLLTLIDIVNTGVGIAISSSATTIIGLAVSAAVIILGLIFESVSNEASNYISNELRYKKEIDNIRLKTNIISKFCKLLINSFEDGNYVLTISNYANIYETNDEHFIIDFSEPNYGRFVDIYYGLTIPYDEAENPFEGNIYPLYDAEHLAANLEDAHNYEQVIPENVSSSFYEATRINEKEYFSSEKIEEKIHDREFKWYVFTNTSNQDQEYYFSLKDLTQNPDLQIESEIYSEINNWNSDRYKIGEFNNAFKTAINDIGTKTTVHKGKSVYIKVHPKNGLRFPTNNAYIKYSLEVKKYKDTYLLDGQELNLPCEYNNNPKENKSYTCNDITELKFSHYRCGYVLESTTKKKYLTLSSIYKKNAEINSAYLEMSFEKYIEYASLDIGMWVQNEGFNSEARVNIYTIGENDRCLFRSLEMNQLGFDKNNLLRFEVNPSTLFKGIRVEVMAPNSQKPQQTNKGRIVLDNFYFEFNH